MFVWAGNSAIVSRLSISDLEKTIQDLRLLVQSGTVDWSETGENEDPAILWALKTHKL